MQQRFHTRNYSVHDFEEWMERGELVLAPKFQRREVWSPKARSYLVDTILRGKPIPKLYMRQELNADTRRTTREVVDGQQRLHTVLTFIKDGFKVSRAHSAEFGGRFFSGLPQSAQRDILKYEFVVDLLQDMPDNEIYDVFARINTYAEKLKAQELRNAQWFGEFKSSVYLLANEFVTFLANSRVFTAKQILRMAEAELISELLLAEEEGIREGKKNVIDNAYRRYDDQFPGRRRHEARFRQTMDTIGAMVGDDLASLRFRGQRLFYPLFCAVYHMRFGLPRLAAPRATLRPLDYPKAKIALERVNVLIDEMEAAKGADQSVGRSAEELRFFNAYDERWVHAPNRVILTTFLCKRMRQALK